MSEDETVELQEGGETGTKLRQFVADIEKADVNQHNFREYMRSTKTNLHIISTQIEHCETNFLKSKRKHEEMRDRIGKDRITSYEKQGLVDKGMYDEINEASYWMGQMFAWQNILSDMLNTMLNKIGRALNITAQYELESVVTERVTKLHEQMMNQTQNLVTELIAQQNHKIDSLNNSMIQRADLLMEKNLLQLQQIQSISLEKSRDSWESLFKLVRELTEQKADMDEIVRKARSDVMDSLQKEREVYREQQAEETKKNDSRKKGFDDEPLPEMKVAPVPKKDVDGNDDSKPFGCPECSKRFSDQLQLDTHIQTTHDDFGGDEEF